MAIKVSKNLLYQILFAICVSVSYLEIYELVFGVWMFTLLVTIKKKYSLKIIKLALPFLAILVISFSSSFFYDNRLYESIRDFTYLIKPIMGLFIGYQLCKSADIKPFETIVYTGLFIALVHMAIIFHSVLIYRIVNIHVLRGNAGYFSDFEIYALIVIIFYKKFELNFSKKKFWTLLSILALSSFLYLSRTNFIQFVILFIVMKGYLSLNKKSIGIFISLLAFTIIGYTIIYHTHPSRNGKGLEALLFKIKNAPIEPFKTKVNKNNWQDFNDNYRSYENITTIRQISYEGPLTVLFGKGMGATVDIGLRVMTNQGTYVRHQPILHNAYMTVFLKSGLVGIFSMIVFMYLVGKHKKSDISIIKNINLLLLATAIYLIIANWVLLGLFLKIDNKSILIGFLICYKHLVEKNKQHLINKNI